MIQNQTLPLSHTPCPISPWDTAQAEFNAYIQQQADEVASEIEVNSLLGAANPIAVLAWIQHTRNQAKPLSTHRRNHRQDACATCATTQRSATVFNPNENRDIYRVWFGTKHLGNFSSSPVTGNWISEAFCRKNKKRFQSSEEAQGAIISARNLN